MPNTTLDGRHRYSSAPELAGAELIVGKGAFEVEVYDERGTLVVAHERAWGERPTETVEPASLLPLLCRKPAGRPNSRVPATLPDDLRAWMDAMDDAQRRSAPRIMRDAAAESGYGPMVAAVERASALGPSPDRASVLLVASGICNGRDAVSYEGKADLAAYDAAFSVAGGDHGA